MLSMEKAEYTPDRLYIMRIDVAKELCNGEIIVPIVGCYIILDQGKLGLNLASLSIGCSW